MTSQLHVVRVFCDEAKGFGNRLGVFLDGPEVPAERRQAVAQDLGYSETVFVEDREAATMRIFTPGEELGFAGHPTVGTAWLLAQEGAPVEALRPPAGEVGVRRRGEGPDALTFVSARAEWSPPWDLIQLAEEEGVEALGGPPEGRTDEVYVWAWIDEDAGSVRSRCWSLADGVGEDEATGSAAIMLAAQLGRALEIEQGLGSVLQARPLGDGWAEVGGRCVLDEVRDYEVLAA